MNRKPIVKIMKKTTPTHAERSVSRKELLQKAQSIDNDEFYNRQSSNMVRFAQKQQVK
jgi:hypothetical protein